MQQFLSLNDIASLPGLLADARRLKADPLCSGSLGKGKTLGLLFFNNSLRTRLSTHKAALNLGMEVIVMNFGSEGWALEFADGTVMDQGSAEHIKEAARVISQYCDIIGIRAFASLKDKAADESERVLDGFSKYATVPLINMESATAHPLQAVADALTIEEHRQKERPKIVLSWAPHPRALPQAVANSFVQVMRMQEADLVITHPTGYELNPDITGNTRIEHDQQKALSGADFVYVKNWSSYFEYGQVLSTDPSWMMTSSKLGGAKFMHCLPVRRNMVVEDAVLDGPNALIIEQANNRTFAAQAVLENILKQM